MYEWVGRGHTPLVKVRQLSKPLFLTRVYKNKAFLCAEEVGRWFNHRRSQEPVETRVFRTYYGYDLDNGVLSEVDYDTYENVRQNVKQWIYVSHMLDITSILVAVIEANLTADQLTKSLKAAEREGIKIFRNFRGFYEFHVRVGSDTKRISGSQWIGDLLSKSVTT